MTSGSPFQHTNTLSQTSTLDFLNTAFSIGEPIGTIAWNGIFDPANPALFGTYFGYPAASSALTVPGPVELTSSSSLISNGNFAINLEFDSSVTTAPSYYVTDIENAASILVKDLRVNNSSTINIQVAYDNPSIGTGAAEGGPSNGNPFSYSQVRAALINNAPGDSNFDALPNTSTISGYNGTGITSWANVDVWSAQEKALGLIPGDSTALDGSVNFGSGIGSSELVGVALHEITHAMGRVPAGPGTPDIFDLFRFVSAGTILGFDTTGTNTPSAYFSVDGGTTPVTYDNAGTPMPVDYGITSDPSDLLNTAGLQDPFTEYYNTITPQTLTPLDLQQMDVLGFSSACFAEATRLATPNGPVPVEALRPGMKLLTVSGAVRPVRWIGCRHLDLTRHPAPEHACPIRIRAGALEEGVPMRDLRVSPEHALYLDGGLVPARLLVNGSSILRESDCHSVVWYHVELDTHDLVLAEGAVTESYLDTGNRGLFENADMPLILHPNFTEGQGARVMHSCAPFLDATAQVEPIWRRLAERAAEAGFDAPAVLPVTTDPDLAIEADGCRFRPVTLDADRYVFVLPSVRGAARLVSRASMPSTLRPFVADRRRLGVAVSTVTIRSAAGFRVITADDPILSDGWFGAEQDAAGPRRWTGGNAALPLEPGQSVVVEIRCQPQSAYVLEPAQLDPIRAAA